jgi:2-hydroxy-3-oxopropionate reductase
MNDKNIGLIGTGIMGLPMARNLLEAGYSITLHSRTRSKAESLLAKGATWTDSPAALAAEVDVVISVVTDSPDVEAVYLGEGGVCEQMREGTMCIDMTTMSPEVAVRVAEAIRAKGGEYLDAPVSGGKTGAEAGTLSIMVGGTEAAVARAKPLFDVMGKNTVHCGPSGTGQLTKLSNQIICGLNLLAISEAMVFAKQAGLDLQTTLNAVSKGAAGSWAVDNLGSRMISRDFAPMFMIDLQQKDLRLALEAARERIVPLPGTSLVHQLLAANQAVGEGLEGTQALVKTLERLANVEK